ncbi:MAG: hypothetical protein Q9205_000741 [Flavoplaca limonia]
MASPMRQARRLREELGESTSPPLASSNNNVASMSTSRFAASRNANTQPTYDFLSGGGGASPPRSQPLQQTVRQSQISRPDLDKENLRAQIKTLQYEVSSLKSDREFEKLRHEQDVQNVQAKADADFKKAQASESSKNISSHKYESMVKQLKETQDQATNRQQALEKKVRTLEEQNQSLQEDVGEGQSALSSLDRQYKHQLQEIESKHATLQKTLSDLRGDLDVKSNVLQATQDRLSKKESEVGHLESENLRLKAQVGDSDTLAVIKRELSDQVTHIRRLETSNREQSAELKHFRRSHKAVEIVEEEKRVLEHRLSLMEDLRKELHEAQLRRQILEDERQSWTSYLQSQNEGEESEFDSPEAVARALMKERVETASLVERLGRIQPELSEKDEVIRALEEERSNCQAEMEKFRSTSNAGDPRFKARLERQRALAVKEVEYLREQLRTFDSEEQTYSENKFDEQKTKRIQDLEALVDNYRQELQTVNDSVSKHESQQQAQETTFSLSSRKRARDENEDDLAGQLSRKNRTLQDDLSALQTTHAQLAADFSATKSQLQSLQQDSRTRILTLRSNPTDNHISLRQQEIDGLRAENKALLAQFVPSSQPNSSSPPSAEIQTVPVHSLNNARAELSALETVVAEKEKRMLRLKQIWSLKSLEFREAVASLLGWQMDFLPNGRFRLTSIFRPGGEDEEEGGGGGGNTGLVFDGETGTMKIAGGPDSRFGREVRPLIRFWVEERKEIPGESSIFSLELSVFDFCGIYLCKRI